VSVVQVVIYKGGIGLRRYCRNNSAVIPRSASSRVSKDAVQRCARSHPSRRRKGALLRMTFEIVSQAFRMTLRFAETSMLILLLGQITRCCVQPLLQKYFVLHLTQLSCLFLAIPSRERGRWPSSLTLGRGAVDADALLTNSA
jgi:hypothetical protein